MSYTQIVFITCILEKKIYTHPLEGSYIVHNHIDASFLFILQEDFYVTHKYIDAFHFIVLQEDFDTFHVLLFEAFLYFFDNSYLSFLYI